MFPMFIHGAINVILMGNNKSMSIPEEPCAFVLLYFIDAKKKVTTPNRSHKKKQKTLRPVRDKKQ